MTAEYPLFFEIHLQQGSITKKNQYSDSVKPFAHFFVTAVIHLTATKLPRSINILIHRHLRSHVLKTNEIERMIFCLRRSFAFRRPQSQKNDDKQSISLALN